MRHSIIICLRMPDPRSAATALQFAVAILALGLIPSQRAFGADCADTSAKVVSVQGTVEGKRAGGSGWTTVALNDELCPNDAIRVAAKSRADVLFANQSVLRLKEGTELVIEEPKSESSYALDLIKGAAHFFSRRGERSLDVHTPFTVAGVRGTEFAVEVGSDSTVVRVFEGSVLAANASGNVLLARGQTAVAAKGQAPVLRIEARPRDAVRWTLYYPPVLYVGSRATGGAPWQAAVTRSADAYRKGDIDAAFTAIESVRTEDAGDAGFFAYRASLSLAVGRIEEASADIARAHKIAPDDADALAVSTIIALAANDQAAALTAARRAVAANSDSASAHVALSYALQAHFDLEGARASLEEAVRLEPDNALAWARLAELHASFGDINASAAAAERAASIDPDLARTRTVRGFALLSQVDTAGAAKEFQKAIELDPADPLPRLGSGLAKIRDGNLSAGAREIEVAASLDPNNALIRSYLGKVYFEEKRTGLDEREYDMAKELDPNDPTPWFYDAIAKQTTNRPVEALRSIEKAIELNDNRAIYRSRLLLDSDLAARSAGLGRIYSDLGFQQLALVEGWKSVSADPGNHSAHRLLADSYAALPRHEIARVSELLKSQLLQPANMTPIQPRLGESNLFLLSSQGPATQSFSEFNPLFNRDQVGVLASGLGGDDDTWAGEGIVSGIQGKLSFSGGYSAYRTDGFRTNNDQDDDIANLFLQYELSPATSIQTEFRYRDLQNGDLELRFLADDFSPFSNEDKETYSGRLGFRHAFSPGSTVLLSYIHQEDDTKFNEFVPDPIFGDFAIDLDIDETGDTFEAQYIGKSGELGKSGWFGDLVHDANTTIGFGHATVDSDETNTTTFGPFPPDVLELEPDVQHTNLYAYSDLSLAEDVTLTLGVSRDIFKEEDGQGKKSRTNPKLGIIWNPSFAPNTTVRAAGFRVLTRTLITQATLEPTQVAGFNQFFDDPPGTEAWRYGAAVDQRFGKNVFGGVEFSKRDLEVPTQVFGAGNVAYANLDWDEKLARTYVFWTPHEWVAARAEYAYEEFKRDEDSFFAFSDLKTHRVPFGVLLTHPCGGSISLGATYMNQDGDFLRNSDFTYQSGDRDFWVVDTGLRYRLPDRHGFVSFGINNILDEDATYQATDVRNPELRPGRFVFGSVTLAIP